MAEFRHHLCIQRTRVGIPRAVEKDEQRLKSPPADEDGQVYGPGDPDKWADSMLNVDERCSPIAQIIDWAECRGRLLRLDRAGTNVDSIDREIALRVIL